MMQFKELNMSGVYEISPRIVKDDRGAFVKTFHEGIFHQHGLLETEFKEEYYSISKEATLRGLHFQLPPDEHVKLVYCIEGKVQDVLLDLRKGSPSYLKAITLELSGSCSNVLYIPKGIAHGFLTISDQAVMVYKTSTVYVPESDYGVSWKSCEGIWQITKPLILSERDQLHPLVANFKSPFVF
ncbi:dTDP-4-dehydrorhamnose 3,5-epimerase family protein [Thiotrichales bacterium 19S3-7]|nr:dTDP-4-dehydrorhamnose 3,5-epimerase family protein [Thiotrichales bacterium 19S3-7]MCF6800700.1 dTDP-4-dehydrorhamnose 3,5-epimerase family protein [Thiotrichales bacterium 19S3-11]